MISDGMGSSLQDPLLLIKEDEQDGNGRTDDDDELSIEDAIGKFSLKRMHDPSQYSLNSRLLSFRATGNWKVSTPNHHCCRPVFCSRFD